jgi:predicted RNA-binding Zn ribbon-like protein
VTGVEQVELGVGHVIQVGAGTRFGEERVVAAPRDERGRSVLAQPREVRRVAADAVGQARRGKRVDPADLVALNDAQRAAPAIRELTGNGALVTAARRRAGPAGARLAAWLAEETADLLTSGSITKVRECEAEDCIMLFLPAHPRRRWCSAARCGNRVRVARHYRRHKPT